jgi:hypothetical protein
MIRATISVRRGTAGSGAAQVFTLAAALVWALVAALPCSAQTSSKAASPPNLQGVYQAIPASATLPGGLKNQGSPSAISLLPEAAQQAKTFDLKRDPWKLCQPVGQFRMMAAQQVKLEIVQTKTSVTMLFEDLAHGQRHSIYLTRQHPAKLEPNWLGDAVGHWAREADGNKESDTLVVDTIGLNDQTWLNSEGAQHSDALHLVERIRPVLAGQYLEYRMTAEDPKTLATPYSYTRYFKKLDTEVEDDPCEYE